jgi:L-rhamnose mutarotase
VRAEPRMHDWWKITDPMQSPLSTRKDGEWWAPMEEVFHHD